MDDLGTIIIGIIGFFIICGIFRAIFPMKSSVKKFFLFALLGWLLYMFTKAGNKKKRRSWYE